MKKIFFQIYSEFHRSLLALLGITIIGALACNNKSVKEVQNFYYWKTNYHLSNYEKDYLQKNKIQKIYLHCFDIVLEDSAPKPQGVLLWKDSVQTGIDYIPTVFIENEVFKIADTSYLQDLALKTLSLCKQILQAQNMPLQEIQIDCDWTKSTRDSYFYFLILLKNPKINVSATLRLYQYKYRAESGIPPVDYVSLMCYNMGNMKTENARNSILNKKDLETYLHVSQAYPMPLNIALPIFKWTLLYSNHMFAGILYQVPDLKSNHWKKNSEINYICIQDYYDDRCERIFHSGESVRIESISKNQLDEARQTIQKYTTNSKNEIIYFDLDSSKISACLH